MENITDMERFFTRQLNASILELETMLMEFEGYLKRVNNLPVVFKDHFGEPTIETKAEVRIFGKQFEDIHNIKVAISSFKDLLEKYKLEAAKCS